MNIHLEKPYVETVKQILLKHGFQDGIYAFGSRVRGDHKKYSDLDLVYKSPDNGSSLTPKALARLKTEFEDSDLPITVDLVDWSLLTPEFKRNIEPDMIAF